MTTSVTAGKAYKFRYRAKNVFGWGPYSDILNLYAASVPNQISTATTVNIDTNVKISWSAPAYNGGSPVTAYRILVQQEDGAFSE